MKIYSYFDIDSWSHPENIVFHNLLSDKQMNAMAPLFRKQTRRFIIEIDVPNLNDDSSFSAKIKLCGEEDP